MNFDDLDCERSNPWDERLCIEDYARDACERDELPQLWDDRQFQSMAAPLDEGAFASLLRTHIKRERASNRLNAADAAVLLSQCDDEAEVQCAIWLHHENYFCWLGGAALSDAREMASRGQLDELTAWLARNPRRVDEDAETASALHIAAAARNPECVDALLKAGANPIARGVNGWTPLHAAVHARSFASVEMMLRRSHARVEDSRRETPLLAALRLGAMDIARALIPRSRMCEREQAALSQAERAELALGAAMPDARSAPPPRL